MEIVNIEDQDDLVWEKTKSIDSFIAYKKYLRLFPNGKYCSVASQRIVEFKKLQEEEEKEREEALWQEAINKGNYNLILRYKMTYPQGKHIEEAENKLSAKPQVKTHESSDIHYNGLFTIVLGLVFISAGIFNIKIMTFEGNAIIYRIVVASIGVFALLWGIIKFIHKDD